MQKACKKVPVTIRLPGMLARFADGARAVEIEATTLGDLIDELVNRFPLLEVHLFVGGRLREHMNMFYNTESVKQLKDWRIPLRPGDQVTILQAVSGG